MKKVILFFLIHVNFSWAQSITLSPTGPEELLIDSKTPTRQIVAQFNGLGENYTSLYLNNKSVSNAFVGFGFLKNNGLITYMGIDPSKNFFIGRKNFSAGDIKISGQAGSLGNVGIGLGFQTPTAGLHVNDFTKLGLDAPAIKVKKYVGTTSNTQGAFVDIITDINPVKVIAVNLMVEYNPGSYVPQSYDLNPNYDYNWFASPNSSNFFTISLRTKLGNSSLILSKPIIVLVTYEE